MGKAGWAILDHGSFAIANFLLNLLLARWLSTTDYGVFTVGYGIFLLFGTIHSALVTEPLVVFGAGRHQQNISRYIEAVLIGNFRVTAFTSLLLLIGALLFAVFENHSIALCLLTLAFVSPLILMQWMMRRASYLCSDGSLAARAGLGYVAILLPGAVFLNNYNLLSFVAALLLMGIASLVTGSWIIFRLKLAIVPGRWTEFREEIYSHWNYGRWSIGTGAMGWATGNLYYLILPIWGGLEATAAFRALQNFLLPILHLAVGLVSVLLPVLVRARQSNQFPIVIYRIIIVTLFLSCLYWFGIANFGEDILRWSYGGKYMEHAELFWILGLTAVCFGMAFVLRLVLLALEKPESVFKAYLVSTVFIVTAGVAIVMSWNIWGAAFVMLVSLAITAVIMAVFVYLEIQRLRGDMV